jgi:diadenosine tetraphosphate (Ap4A) HIT family hydrolase
MKSILTFDQRKPILKNNSAKAIFDNYPVNKGHMLVIPYKKTRSIFNLSLKEYRETFELVRLTRNYLKKKFKVISFTIGINDGKLAGQTVKQAHIHIIPRYKGDTKNPTGGIRGVVAKKKYYK